MGADQSVVEEITTRTAEDFYLAAPVEMHEVEHTKLAVRVFGQGPALVLIHGYPLHGYTWRKLLPALAMQFRCYVVDLPGLGDSEWGKDIDVSFTAQARRLALLTQQLKLQDYALIAHDTGATVARLVALLQPDRVAKLALINTEIPGHRPPWIPFYQLFAKLPLAQTMFKQLLGSPWFLRSPMALGQFFYDKKLFATPDVFAPYIKPLVNSDQRMAGMIAYLQGIEWDVIDQLRERHRHIRAATLLLWGENDKTFPVELAEDMCSQFSSSCRLVRIKAASLMPHEERPEEVLRSLLPFLTG